MTPTRRAALAGLSAAALATSPAAYAATYPGRFDYRPAFPSRFVAARDVRVWIPAAYRPGGPVIYMQDEQNLYEAFPGPFGFWGVEGVLDRLIGERAVAPPLVVGVASGALRFLEYMPKGVWDRLTPAYRQAARQGHAGEPLSDAYLRFLVEELKPWVDATFRSSRRREDTVVLGSSMGGLIAFYAACERPDTFGAAGCISTHWTMRFPLPLYTPTAADAQTVAAAVAGYLDARKPRPGRTRFYFDHGDKGLDAGYAPFQTRIDALLKARGWREGRDLLSRYFAGGDHTEPSWRARLDVPLRFLLPPSGAAA